MSMQPEATKQEDAARLLLDRMNQLADEAEANGIPYVVAVASGHMGYGYHMRSDKCQGQMAFAAVVMSNRGLFDNVAPLASAFMEQQKKEHHRLMGQVAAYIKRSSNQVGALDDLRALLAK